MPIIIFVVVMLGIFWLMNLIATILAWIIAIPLIIFFLTPLGQKIWNRCGRSHQLFQDRFWALVDGFGFPYTRKNTIKALQRYVDMRHWVGEVETWEVDQDWAIAELKKMGVEYNIPLNDQWRLRV